MDLVSDILVLYYHNGTVSLVNILIVQLFGSVVGKKSVLILFFVDQICVAISLVGFVCILVMAIINSFVCVFTFGRYTCGN